MNLTLWNRKHTKKKITETKKIDFVYTYVDSTDTKWLSIYKNTFPEENVDKIRYQDYGEIYFSLQTVQKYAKAVCNNIYIVTMNQTLDHSKLSTWVLNKIKYISHTDIIPEDFLPTFNSITIETFLHLIPDITPNFIYLNDDVFLGNYLTNDFLYYNGTLNILIQIHRNKKYEFNKNKPWEHYYLNGDIIFKKETGLQSDIIPKHTIYLMNKKVCYITWILFQDELLKNITQKRNTKNINFWYLCYNVGLYLGYYSYKIPTVKESQILYCDREANNNMKRRLINEVKMLFKNKPIVFCFNNMNEECIHLWNFIRKKYIKWNKKI